MNGNTCQLCREVKNTNIWERHSHIQNQKILWKYQDNGYDYCYQKEFEVWLEENLVVSERDQPNLKK